MTALPAARALVLAAATVVAATGAQARPARRHPGVVSTDTDRVLTRMAAEDALVLWPGWRERRDLARSLPPATHERVAAPPFTGWGYGETIPGAWPSFR